MVSAKSHTFRTQVSLPRKLHQDLKKSLIKRAAIAADKGEQREISFSAWVREQALATVAKYK